MLRKSLRFLPLLALICSSLWAQDYPLRPVVIVVPFTAGGPTDTLARYLGSVMSPILKQSVLIDNTAGAGGTIAYNKVAKSKPDLITYVKANKDKLNLANAGIGAASHLCGLLFMSAIQTNLTTVPYSGTGPAMNALLGGQVDLMCDQTTNTTPHIIAGKVKVYGVTSKTRIPALRFVPTLNEAGLKNFELVVWHGLYAPKGTPKPVVDKLIAVLQEAVKDPTFKSQLANIGAEPVPVSKANPESLRSHLKSEIEKWAKIIKAANVPVN